MVWAVSTTSCSSTQRAPGSTLPRSGGQELEKWTMTVTRRQTDKQTYRVQTIRHAAIYRRHRPPAAWLGPGIATATQNSEHGLDSELARQRPKCRFPADSGSQITVKVHITATTPKWSQNWLISVELVLSCMFQTISLTGLGNCSWPSSGTEYWISRKWTQTELAAVKCTSTQMTTNCGRGRGSLVAVCGQTQTENYKIRTLLVPTRRVMSLCLETVQMPSSQEI